MSLVLTVTTILIASTIFLGISLAKVNKQIAAEHHKKGMKLVKDGDYNRALAYLRSSVRHDNSSSTVWNDLGVTELRMNYLQASKRRFMKAISLDPSEDSMARENLQIISTLLSPGDFRIGMKAQYPVTHKLNEIPTITFEEFVNLQPDSHLLQKPFLIRNLAQHLGWAIDRISPEFLTRAFGDHRVDFYPHNMKFENVHPFFTSMKLGLQQLLEFPLDVYDSVDASEPGTYIQWNIAAQEPWSQISTELGIIPDQIPAVFQDHWWMDQCFNQSEVADFNHKTHWRMLLIGEADAGMFIHKDVLRTSSWQLQLSGRKRWALCSSSDDRRLYGAGMVDLFNPEYNRFPRLKNLQTCSDFVVEAGDFIFYPKDYWHQTQNLDTPSMALSGTTLTVDCYHEIMHSLQMVCRNELIIFTPDPIQCAQFESCHDELKLLFAESPRNRLHLDDPSVNITTTTPFDVTGARARRDKADTSTENHIAPGQSSEESKLPTTRDETSGTSLKEEL